MNNPLRTIADYELFLYTLREQFPGVLHSTLTLVRTGATLARVSGELHFAENIRMIVRERIVYRPLSAALTWYGYEVWRGAEKLYWYDSQPHPNDPTLQSTHPHHKHIPPDIKHHRIPAPEMSFYKPNLPALIREVEALIATVENEDKISK
jgi:hypothetical protein